MPWHGHLMSQHERSIVEIQNSWCHDRGIAIGVFFKIIVAMPQHGLPIAVAWGPVSKNNILI